MTLAQRTYQRTGGAASWTVTPEGGGVDPWANGPVDAVMALAGVAELPEKKRRKWARKISELAAQWGATPEQAATAIKAIHNSDQGWRTFAGPYEPQFASVFDVMMGRLKNGSIGPGKVIRVSL